MSDKYQIVFDEWGTYVSEDEEQMVFVSYDEGATREDRPVDLHECIRVVIQMHLTEDEQLSPEENTRLYEMEEELCELLQQEKVYCRLTGRLTYEDTREIVFQVGDSDAFRDVVADWQQEHDDYNIRGASHDGWSFFDEVLSPDDADRVFMADQSVIETLIENGSDPEKEHSLEYVFVGEPDALEGIATVLLARGYQWLDEPDYASEQIVMCKTMPLDLGTVVAESLANHQLANDCGGECDGWGCAIVP